MELEDSSVARESAERFLNALKKKAEAGGEKLEMPPADMLAPFGLESFA